MQLKDQLGRIIELSSAPKRIISLVPSQTEFLADLGLEDEVIGITKFCVHPEKWFRTKARIGGTKNLNIQKIRDLKPDLIIANKEENDKSQIEALAAEFPVWISDISTLEEAFDMMKQLGKITSKENEALRIIDQITKNFSGFKKRKKPHDLKVAYFIWRKPYMTIGKDTFIHHLLEVCGYKNVFESKSRYPEIALEDLKSAGPDLIFLSSEPYPFKENHFKEFADACPNSKVRLVDGEMFSWYGSRLLYSPGYFASLIEADGGDSLFQ